MRWATALAAAALLLDGCGPKGPTVSASALLPVSSFPRDLDPSCRDGHALIFDECGSQMEIFRRALEEARATNKIVIVSYGAEWCIWCHLFHYQVEGSTNGFRAPVEGAHGRLVVDVPDQSGRDVIRDAHALNAFVSENFVIAEIESAHAPDGRAVLETTGAVAAFTGHYPLIFTVTPAGRFAVKLDNYRVASNNQGYVRASLLAELRRMLELTRRQTQSAP